MTVLVTGANGYLGKHLVEVLNSCSDRYVLLDKKMMTVGDPKKSIPVVSKLDSILDLTKTIKDLRIKTVVHLAALKSVKDSIEDPKHTVHHNVVTTHNLLQACRNSGVEKFIFASSAAVYQPNAHLEATREQDFTNPGNPYGESKLICEKLLQTYTKDFGVVALRFFNLIGSTSQNNMDSLGENFIPIALRSLYSRNVLQIYGNTFATKDGHAVRDFIDVRDASHSILKAIDFLSNHNDELMQIFNISSQREVSVLDIINGIEDLSGLKLNIQYQSPRQGEMPYMVGDSELARDLLKWNPTISIVDSLSDDFKHFSPL